MTSTGSRVVQSPLVLLPTSNLTVPWPQPEVQCWHSSRIAGMQAWGLGVEVGVVAWAPRCARGWCPIFCFKDLAGLLGERDMFWFMRTHVRQTGEIAFQRTGPAG